MPSENLARIPVAEPEVFVDAQDITPANDSENTDGQGIYAESFLPEGVEMSGAAEVGHGFADAPPVDAPTEVISEYDGAVQGTVTREFDLGDLALVPKEMETARQELDAQGSAMMHLINETPAVTNLGNELNKIEAGGTAVNVEGRAEVSPTEVGAKVGAALEANPVVLAELNIDSPEKLAEVKAEAGVAAEAVLALSPEQQEKTSRGIENIGYTVEQGKNKIMGKTFGWVTKQMFGDENLSSAKGTKGTIGRYLAAFADTYKERNEDLDRKMDLIEETRKMKGSSTAMQKLGQTMQVTGGVLRWGRMIKEATSWTVAAPLRIGQIIATAAETGTRVAKEARLKNEEVINQTRISDENLNDTERASAWETYQKDHADDKDGTKDTPENRAMASHEFTVNKAADEAWEIYARAEQKHRLDPKNEGKGGVAAEDLKRAYSEGLPKDILKRLEENPVPGDTNNIAQRLFRKHLEVEVGQMQKKLDAIDADQSMTAAGKEKARERYMDQWGNGKTLKDFDRMLTQNGSVDAIAMGMRYGTGAAKVASLALMGGSLKMLWDKAADMLTSSHAGAEAVAGTVALSEIPGGESFMAQAGYSPEETLAPLPDFTQSETTWAESGTGLNVLPEDLTSVEHDATWREGATGLLMTEEDAISADMAEATLVGTSAESSGKILEVVSGNTLSGMLSEKLGLTPAGTYRMLLNMNPSQLKELGIRPEDIEKFGANAIDHIYPGQKINLSVFEEIAKKSGSGAGALGAVASSGAVSGGTGMGGGNNTFLNSGILMPFYGDGESTETGASAVAEQAAVQPVAMPNSPAATSVAVASAQEAQVAVKPNPIAETLPRATPNKVPSTELISPMEKNAVVVREEYLKADAGRRAQIANAMGVPKSTLDKQFGIPSGVERPTAEAVLRSKLNASKLEYQGALSKIDMKEEERVASIEAAYRNKVERLMVANENAIENKNVRSINKGVGEVSKIIQGRKTDLGRVIMNEATSRIQGGITSENRLEQALQAAEMKRDSDIRSARSTFDQLRSKAEMTQGMKEIRLGSQAEKLGAARPPAPQEP